MPSSSTKIALLYRSSHSSWWVKLFTMWIPTQFTETKASRRVVFYRKECHILLRVPTHVLASGCIWTREKNVNTGQNSQKSPLKCHTHPVLLEPKSPDPPPPPICRWVIKPLLSGGELFSEGIKKNPGNSWAWVFVSTPTPSTDRLVLKRCSWFVRSFTRTLPSEATFYFILSYWILLFSHLFKTPGRNKIHFWHIHFKR